MATVLSRPHTTPAATARSDRLFYRSIAIAMALAVLIGFGPTYYFAAFEREPMVTISGASMTPLVHVHGALFTAWVLLFVVQTTLVAQRKVAVHRRLGIAGAGLAAVMVVAGALTTTHAAARGSAPPGVDPLSFMLVPLTDMLMFGSFVTMAIWLRADREAHKRLMLLAYVSLLGAPFARFPGVLPLGPFAFFGLAFSFMVAGVIYDLVSRRRVHPVYLWGGAALIASVPLRLMISATAGWKAAATWAVSLI